MPARPRSVVFVVLTATALAGCAGTGAPSAPARAAGPVTQVLTFQAYDAVGLLPSLARTVAVAGSCQGGSVVHPGRADAWRCRAAPGAGAGEVALDPCFANGTGEELACVTDPWAQEATVLRPPTPLGRVGQNRNDPGLPPWFLELADGTRCGRTPPAGYRCTGASAGAELGDPDTTRPLWRVRGTVGGAPVTADVRTAWY